MKIDDVRKAYQLFWDSAEKEFPVSEAEVDCTQLLTVLWKIPGLRKAVVRFEISLENYRGQEGNAISPLLFQNWLKKTEEQLLDMLEKKNLELGFPQPFCQLSLTFDNGAELSFGDVSEWACVSVNGP